MSEENEKKWEEYVWKCRDGLTHLTGMVGAPGNAGSLRPTSDPVISFAYADGERFEFCPRCGVRIVWEDVGNAFRRTRRVVGFEFFLRANEERIKGEPVEVTHLSGKKWREFIPGTFDEGPFERWQRGESTAEDAMRELRGEVDGLREKLQKDRVFIFTKNGIEEEMASTEWRRFISGANVSIDGKILYEMVDELMALKGEVDGLREMNKGLTAAQEDLSARAAAGASLERAVAEAFARTLSHLTYVDAESAVARMADELRRLQGRMMEIRRLQRIYRVRTRDG